MMSKAKTLLPCVLLLCLAANQGCAPFHTRGIENVRNLYEPYVCNDVSILPPRVEGVRYVQRSVFPEAFQYECSSYYTLRRENSIWNFDFSFEVIPLEKLPVKFGSLKEMAEAIVEAEEVKYEHKVKRMHFEETLFRGHPAVRFEFSIVATYVGDLGSEIVEIGYLLPNPCSESWIAIYYTDHFRESAGESPDLQSRSIGEDFLESLRIDCDS